MVKNYKNANFHALTELLTQVNWNNTVFYSDNINEIFLNFVSSLNNCIDNHIPKQNKNIAIRPRGKVYMNNSIRKLMRKRNRAHYKVKHTDNPQHWQSNRKFRNTVIDEIRKSCENYKMFSMIDKSIPPGK